MLVEKYKPKTEFDLIGNEKNIDKFKQALAAFVVDSELNHCFLHGPPGVGKTSAVYVVAKRLGFNVIEINASDQRGKEQLKNISRRSSMRSLTGKTLYLLDEVDGVRNWSGILDILKRAKNPVVLVANEGWKVNWRIKKLCTVIRFYQPRVHEVRGLIKKLAEMENKEFDVKKVSRDVRSSINTALVGGDGYTSKIIFDKILEVFSHGRVEGLERSDLIWLVDNAPKFYRGRDLYEFMEMLASIRSRGRFDVLRETKEARGRVVEPYYLRRRKVLGGKR